MRSAIKPAKQILFSKEDIDHFCAVALSNGEDGKPKFKNGQMLVDAVRFMENTGARVKSVFALRWSDIQWDQDQIHFTRGTKYSKHIVVEINDELRPLLKKLHDARHSDTDAVFPGTKAEGSQSVGSLRKTFELVREAAKLPGIQVPFTAPLLHFPLRHGRH